MNNVAHVRLKNLKRLGATATGLQQSVGHSYSHWRDILVGGKSFGEKTARKIEEALFLERGILDIDSDVPVPNPQDKSLAITVGQNTDLKEAPTLEFSAMARDLAIEFDAQDCSEREKRINLAHCMLLITRNPLTMRALGLGSYASPNDRRVGDIKKPQAICPS